MSGITYRRHTGPLLLLSLLRRLFQTRDAIHVFCSPWEKLPLIVCLFFCAQLGYRYYLISEPYSTEETPYFGTKPTFLSRLKKRLRPYIYRLYGKLIRSSVQSVFAISDLAMTQYASIGVETSKIVPFGYFVPQNPCSTPEKQRDEKSDRLRAVFIGSISARKGIDTLIETCRLLEARKAGVTIDVYGPGDISMLEGSPDNLVYQGRIRFGETQNVLANYDVMVLLSKHDGWGVVVNEALLSGRAVVCTEAVGASRLVREHQAGIIVRTADAGKAAEALHLLSNDRPALSRLQAGARRAAESIQPEDAAMTVWRVLQASDPTR